MKTYKVEAEIQAESLGDANRKAAALANIGRCLNLKELIKLEDVLLNNPFVTALAKRQLGLL